MAGFRPKTRANELAFVFGVRPEAALLGIGHGFNHEAKGPDQEANQGEWAQRLTGHAGDGGQGSRQGEGHPQPLQRPGVEKTEEGGLEIIKARVLPCLQDAAKEKGSQPPGPDHHQDQQQDRTAIDHRAEQHSKDDHRDVGDAAGQVKELLCLQQVGRYER